MTFNRRFAAWTIGLLVILNLSTISLIWMKEIRRPPQLPRKGQVDEDATLRFLKQELALNGDQVRQFKQFRKRHFQKVRILRKEISRLKKQQLTDALFEDEPDMAKATQVARMIAEKQFELERLTFEHFVELKSLFGEKQRGKMHALLKDLFLNPRSDSPSSPPPPPQRRPPR